MVSMMTGLTTPTSGDCLINGCSIVEDTEQARQCLGYCPQSNVMYGRLSVLEHLQIYAAVKGLHGGAWSTATLRAAEEIIEVIYSSLLFDHHALVLISLAPCICAS